MAVYEFKCKDCDIIIEEEHSMKEAPSDTKCPDCGKTVGRFYGSMNFVLKGNDWPGKIVKRSQNKNGGKGMTIDEVVKDRKSKGLDTRAKEKPMSDAEFKRRKELNMKWIEENNK